VELLPFISRRLCAALAETAFAATGMAPRRLLSANAPGALVGWRSSVPAPRYPALLGVLLAHGLVLALLASGHRPHMPETVPLIQATLIPSEALAGETPHNDQAEAPAPSSPPPRGVRPRPARALPEAASARVELTRSEAARTEVAHAEVMRTEAVRTEALKTEGAPVQAVTPVPAPAPQPEHQPRSEPWPVPMPAAPVNAEPARTTTAALPGRPDDVKRYVAALMRQLNRHKTYPAELKKAKTEGRVVLQFTLDKAGRLVASAVKQSSGHPALDRAALDMLTRASPLPAIPDFMARDELALAIPVEYSLITDR